ncbi:MAG: 5-(carboxyamino)imidazole ribonucleotide mutase [Candidatus Paceibacterota bacterium]
MNKKERVPFLGKLFRLPGQIGPVVMGKVRDIYDLENILVFVVSDRISAFDKNLPFDVKNKGTILNQIACLNMEQTKDIIPNSLLYFNSRIAVMEKCEPFKVEFVWRRYMEGSYHRDIYSKGQKDPWGYELSKGIRYQEKLPELMFTPTTKSPDGTHDLPISLAEILEQKLMKEEEYIYLKEKSRKLFIRGEELADKQGLILVDTKYEFGKNPKGHLKLIDEIHTPDSSRYFYKEGYEARFAAREDQKQLSKEFVRQHLISLGYQGEEDQIMPEFDGAFIQSVEDRYLLLYREYTGNDLFDNNAMDKESVARQIYRSLADYYATTREVEIGIIMGSESDLPIMEKAAMILLEAGIPFKVDIVSAHRTPLDLKPYTKYAEKNEFKVIIAGAGGASHLAGMAKANTIIPVIGVPIQSPSNQLQGDSLSSTVQMPEGVPVATVAINGAGNAGILALEILATSDDGVKSYMKKYKKSLIKKVTGMRSRVREFWPSVFSK